MLVACECARLALPYVPKGEKRPLKAIEVAEAWVRGEVTIEEVRDVADAADAAYAAYAADAAYTTYAACAADAAARKNILAKCADIVRKHYPIIRSRRKILPVE